MSQDFRTELERATRLHREGETEKAIAIYRRLSKVRPGAFDVRRLLVFALLQAGRVKEALASARRLKEQNPKAPQAHLLFGACAQAGGDVPAALAAFELASELDPGQAEAHYLAGNMLGALTRYEEAVARFDQAIALDPRNSEARVNRAALLSLLGREEDALLDYVRLTELQPWHAPYFVLKSRAQASLGRFAAAAESAGAALSLAPRDADALAALGTARLGLEDPRAALTAFEMASISAPERMDLRAHVIDLQRRLGNLEAAEAACSAALAVAPGASSILLARAALRHEAGDAAGALGDLALVLADEPDHADAESLRALIVAQSPVSWEHRGGESPAAAPAEQEAPPAEPIAAADDGEAGAAGKVEPPAAIDHPPAASGLQEAPAPALAENAGAVALEAVAIAEEAPVSAPAAVEDDGAPSAAVISLAEAPVEERETVAASAEALAADGTPALGVAVSALAPVDEASAAAPLAEVSVDAPASARMAVLAEAVPVDETGAAAPLAELSADADLSAAGEPGILSEAMSPAPPAEAGSGFVLPAEAALPDPTTAEEPPLSTPAGGVDEAVAPAGASSDASGRLYDPVEPAVQGEPPTAAVEGDGPRPLPTADREAEPASGAEAPHAEPRHRDTRIDPDRTSAMPVCEPDAPVGTGSQALPVVDDMLADTPADPAVAHISAAEPSAALPAGSVIAAGQGDQDQPAGTEPALSDPPPPGPGPVAPDDGAAPASQAGGRPTDALRAAEKALSEGRWTEGWAGYEHRMLAVPALPACLPRWDGRTAPASLLVVGEGGIGDELLFGRLLRVLADRGIATTLLTTPAHVALLSRIDARVRVIGDPAQADLSRPGLAWVPLGSLPLLLAPDPAFWPRPPYLAPDPVRVARSRRALTEALEGGEDGLVVGLGWDAGVNGAFPLAAVEPLTRVAGIRLVSVATPEAEAELVDAPFGGGIILLKRDGDDLLADTAGLVQHLDLVVTGAGALAHLLGARGRADVVVAPPHDWRWRQANPFYPTLEMRRFADPAAAGEALAARLDRLTASLKP